MRTAYRWSCLFICLWLFTSSSTATPNAALSQESVDQEIERGSGSSDRQVDSEGTGLQLGSQLGSQFSEKDLAAVQQVTQSLGLAEWLGPLAPLALSPFFGIACLSGLSLFGGGWIGGNNPFLGEASPLHSELVFGVFLILTFVTSLPRLTKISKPFVQLTDQLEAWAGIITMLTLKFLLTTEVTTSVPEDSVVTLGLFSATAEVFLMIAAVLNVLVINSVKFFCEMFIWVIPVPAIDAAFEAFNKSVCAALMMIYGYSPYLATCINLSIFLVAAIVFRWIYRQEIYFRTVLVDAVWHKIFPPKILPATGLTVFLGDNFQGLKYRSRCVFLKTDNGWQLTQRRWLGSDVILILPSKEWSMSITCGLFAHSICAQGVNEKMQLTFTRKYHSLLPELSECLGITPPPASGLVVPNEKLAILPE